MRTPSDHNIRIALVFIFTLTFSIFAAVFITDWYFTAKDGTRLLDGTLTGVIIGAPIQWIGAIIAFYFATKLMTGKGDDE